jgi:hypothetical protein
LNALFTTKRIINNDDSGLPGLSRKFISSFITELKSCVECYYQINNPLESNFTDTEKMWLERLSRLKEFNSHALLLSLFTNESNSKKREKVLEAYEKFVFLQTIRGIYRIGRKHIPKYVADYTSAKISTEDLHVQIENLCTDMFKDSSVGESLHEWVKSGANYYVWKPIRYFLFEYELSLKLKSKSERMKIDWEAFSSEDFSSDYYTVEHIFPQTARDIYWSNRFTGYSATQKKTLKNSLGNLLALSNRKNSSLGNKSFLEKKNGNDSTLGYSSGSYSEIEVSKLDDWGPKEIVLRGFRMLEFFEKRWRVSLGDKEGKLKALGTS